VVLISLVKESSCLLKIFVTHLCSCWVHSSIITLIIIQPICHQQTIHQQVVDQQTIHQQVVDQQTIHQQVVRMELHLRMIVRVE